MDPTQERLECLMWVSMDGATIPQYTKHRKKCRFQEEKIYFFFRDIEFEVYMGPSGRKTVGLICVSIFAIC